MSNALDPNASTLIKIGSLIVHYQEWNSDDGHPLDLSAIKQLENDDEVKQWLDEMDKQGWLPKKRR